MDLETLIKETLEELLKRINSPFRRIKVEKKDDNSLRFNIESEEPSLLIGKHGENIGALQIILKNLVWKEVPDSECNFTIDVDDYRKRQEDQVIKLADRKVEMARKTNSVQSLPPMSPYFRRLIHTYLAKETDIVTESVGEGDFRYLTIKTKNLA